MNATRCFFSAATIDDLMHDAMSEILNRGTATCNIKGNTTELSGVLLELTNPRARLSRSEARGKVYGCLGEFCWYMSGTGDPEFIKYYLKKYDKCIENGAIHGAYGPRLFNWKKGNQFENVVALLKKHGDTRKAVLQLFDSTDLYEKHEDIPCTCTFQFFVREEKLLMITSMRSNDAYIGLPHDVFAFTMIQEYIARLLGYEPGAYKHFVGSLHIYDEHIQKAQGFIDEGYQSTKNFMPPMPSENPRDELKKLLDLESNIRLNKTSDFMLLKNLPSFWADLGRLLFVLAAKKRKDIDEVEKIRVSMSSDVYYPYIDSII